MLGANGIVGAGAPLVCGAALTAKTLKTGGIGVCFYGDGASNQGAVLESYNLAKIWNLPMVFVAEDNGYAETTSSNWSVGGSQVGRGSGFGLPSREINGQDFFEVYEAAGEAIERARSGAGPSLLHVRLTRFYGHFEGDAGTYRAADEVALAKQNKDPIDIFRKRVVGASLLQPADFAAVDKDVVGEVAKAVAKAKAAPMPSAADLLTDVYVSY
jgi:pyruvate dehydrogenase E1 component alpha subunit